MRRSPSPGPSPSGWEESTEGDLDYDLTEEAGSRVEDWDDRNAARLPSLVQVVSLVVLVAILGAALGSVVLR